MTSRLSPWGLLGTGATAAAGALVLSAASASAAAAAPTLTVTNPKQCFINTNTATSHGTVDHPAIVDVKGTGWTPGDAINVNFPNSAGIYDKTVGSDGTFTGTVKLPDASIENQTESFALSSPLTAVDTTAEDNGAAAADYTATSKPINYTLRQVSLWQGQTVQGGGSDLTWNNTFTFKASGFAPGKPVYAHYLMDGPQWGGGRKLVTTIVLGRASGPCGVVTSKRHIFPFKPKPAQEGYYTLGFSSAKGYSAKTNEYSYLFTV